jgi:hypothetical protein
MVVALVETTPSGIWRVRAGSVSQAMKEEGRWGAQPRPPDTQSVW